MIKLIDVLHLYIGCQMKKSDESGEFKLTPHTLSQMSLPNTAAYIKEALPILKPLDSMTEEDLFMIDENWNLDEAPLSLVKKTWSTEHIACRPDQFIGLLKLGFDLFGLIESQQALPQ